jgi:cystathionine beta-lyase/cystathionine gamma-synthase
MGAISAAILHGIRQGSHIVSAQQIYGPTNNFMQEYLAEKCGVDISYTDGSVEGYRRAIRKNTSLFYLESPGSLKFPVQDIRGIADLARRRRITTVIDNTWSTPLFQRPLDMGIDLEVHSCSKYLGGHSDIVAGVIIGSKKHLDQIQLREQAWLGAKMAPFEAWLLLRSLRTLPARMARHMENGLAVARFLEQHPAVQEVYYPGLESFAGYDLAQSQLEGYGSLLSFELRTREIDRIKRFANGVRLFKIGVSWGGHDSLIYAPLISYKREQSPGQLAAMGISPGLIRISVGLENARDLIEDLDQALGLIG